MLGNNGKGNSTSRDMRETPQELFDKLNKQYGEKMNKKKLAWKVLKRGMKSQNGNVKWYKGRWKKYKGDIELCAKGYHASKSCYDAMRYVTPGIICQVEYRGEIKETSDKFVCSEMRVIKTYTFTEKNAVEFAIYCARLCLKNFEKLYPQDKRPRAAIEAAEQYLKKPTKSNKVAARSAAESAAWLSRPVAWSARAVAWSARSAAWSAWSAVESGMSARWAARSAAESLRSARPAGIKKIEKKLLEIIGHKREQISIKKFR